MISPYNIKVAEVAPGQAVQIPNGMNEKFQHVTLRLFRTVDGWYNIEDGKPYRLDQEDERTCMELPIPDFSSRRY